MTRSRDVATQGGLVLISSTTVGSAVSSVVVNNAFSAEYDNYRIMYSGGTVSTALSIRMTINNVTNTYENSRINANSRNTSLSNVNTGASQTFWTVGTDITASYGPVLELQLFQPFLTKFTFFRGWNSGFGVSDNQQLVGGYASTALSSTNFTFTTSTGTLTGGTISVYGYKK